METCGIYNGWSALHFAADHPHMEIVKLLVEAGAAVDVKNAVSAIEEAEAEADKKEREKEKEKEKESRHVFMHTCRDGMNTHNSSFLFSFLLSLFYLSLSFFLLLLFPLFSLFSFLFSLFSFPFFSFYPP